MTTLRKELRDKFEEVLLDILPGGMMFPITETAETLADAALEIAGIKSAAQRRDEAEKRITEQRAAKGDVVDLFIQTSPALKEQTLMRQRVENALHRNLDWDSARSPWNGYEKKLVGREKDNGQTIEGFMQWFNSDEFRKKGVIYLNPTKIEDWWLQAFETTLSYDEQLAKAGYK